MKKLLLISLHYYRQKSKNIEKNTPSPDTVPVNPLILMQLAALTPIEYKIIALDNPEKINFDEDYNLVAISSVTSSINDAYKIADEFRKRGVKVVLGGYHASALPDEAKQHADSVVIGEAEDTWPQLLRDLENNKIKSFYEQNKPLPAEKISSPIRNIFTNEYPIASIQAVWGCPYGCEFCAITNSKFGNKPRFRPINDIVKEIATIKQKYLFFCDSSFTINPNYSKELFKNIKDFNKELLMCNGNADVLARDDEFLKLASEAGCLEWLIGFESISQKSLDSIGKKTNKVEEYITAVKKIHDHGMEVIGEFVFGFDHDTPDIFDKTYEFIEKSEIDLPAPGILTPYPGTPLFDRLEREGRILTKDWSKYSEREVVFIPKNMTEEQLFEGTENIKEKIFYLSLENYKKNRSKFWSK